MTRLLPVFLLLAGCGCRKEPPPQRAASEPPPRSPNAPPEDLVHVPAGSFQMGCEPARDPTCSETEQPAHRVDVAGFRIDRREVTRGEYARCVADGACEEPARPAPQGTPEDRPMAGVTWHQADTYCRWRGARLPTEAEWEKAARGTDGRIYPWGDEPPTCDRARMAHCPEPEGPAGSLPAGASPYGALDMAGSVDEWALDPWISYGLKLRGGKGDGALRVSRGGANDAWHVRSTARSAIDSWYADSSLGFRCAQSG